jgi:probable addiction module antidote protein
MPLETTKFDIQDHLKTPEEQAAYIDAALEDGDPSFIALALGDIARARGISAFAAETGLSREAIYKSFRQGGNPTLETLAKATKALGLRLTVKVA